MFTSTRSTGHRKPLARRVALRIGLLGMVGPLLACGFPALTESTNEAQAPQVEVEAQPATATPAPPGDLPTDTATPTSTATPTATYFAPQFTSNVNANCRSGPGTVYDIIGSLPNGTTVPITGKDSTGTWWYVDQAPPCWVSSTTGIAAGDLASVPVLPSPPTPAPTRTPTPTLGIIVNPRIGTIIVPPFAVVSGASVTASPTSYEGTCPYNAVWRGSVTATAALTATYVWEIVYIDGTSAPAATGTLTFAGAGTLSTAIYTAHATFSQAVAMRLHVTAPNSVYSNQVNVTINCTS